MRKTALLLSLLGIIILLLLLVFLPYKEINSELQLNSTLANQKVSVYGLVMKERTYGKSFLLSLDNNIEIISSSKSYLNKTILVRGKVDDFIKKRVKASKIILK